MDRLEAMRTLVAAVDGGSLSAAARALGTPLPTISRRVSELETYLGAQLLVRTSRRLIPTEAGESFIAATRKLLDDLADAERAASGEYRAPRGPLLVTAPIMFGKLHIAPIVHGFLDAYREVTVRLALADHVIDLVEAHVDVAIRIGPLPDSDLVARRVGQVRWTLVASPAHLAAHGTPDRPEALADRSCIAFEGLQPYRNWRFGTGTAETSVAIRPRFSVNTADAVIDAAIAGLGIARVMSYQAAAAVGAGQLVALLPGFAPEPVPVSLVYRSHRSQPLKQRAFLDYVAPRLQSALDRVDRIMA